MLKGSWGVLDFGVPRIQVDAAATAPAEAAAEEALRVEVSIQ